MVLKSTTGRWARKETAEPRGLAWPGWLALRLNSTGPSSEEEVEEIDDVVSAEGVVTGQDPCVNLNSWRSGPMAIFGRVW